MNHLVRPPPLSQTATFGGPPSEGPVFFGPILVAIGGSKLFFIESKSFEIAIEVG
jgi:hypothetical protein